MEGQGENALLTIELTALTFPIVFISAHVTNLFLSWLVHFLQHQKIFGIPFYKVHLKAHHTIDKRHRLTPAHYLYMSIGYVLWAAAIILGSCMAYYLFFTPWVALTFIGDSLLVLAFAYYVHREYDRADSWLKRFEWFRQGRALHQIHHSYFGDEFAKSKIYAFGGPLAGNLIDRVLGTYNGSGQVGGLLPPRPSRRALLLHTQKPMVL